LSASAQMRSRKTPLRSLQRQALAKQQSEQQQQQLRHRYTLDTQPTTTSHGLSTVTALPTYHVSLTTVSFGHLNISAFTAFVQFWCCNHVFCYDSRSDGVKNLL